ncbi:MAG: aminopeptidase P N-terminal domain-containing protein [Candidatus Sericytochromatia bacterium]
MTDLPSSAFYASNRQRLMEAIGPHGVAVIFSAPEATYSHDVHYVYRQNSYLHYLTGFAEANSVLVLAPGHEHPYTLFVMPRDLEKEIWNGFRQGVDGARQNFGADAAFPIAELEARLPELLANRSELYFAFGASEATDRIVFQALNTVRGKIRQGIRAPRHLHDPGLILNEMRLIKQPSEIAAMQRAADISAEAHAQVMRQLRPGMFEYEAEAIIEHHFRRHNSRMAYPAIVGGGVNGTILHYVENNQVLKDGDLLLVDAGAEFAHYNADITRTFPVNGRFSPAQKAVYEVVLASQIAAVEMTRPGVRFVDIHHKAVEVITEGLIDLGLLSGSRDSLIEQGAYQKFYMHRTGHWLGGDVHDVGDYTDASGESRPLAAGMVMTVEPGIYVGPHLAGEVSSEFHHIGIRIEDDILVTEDGHHNFTSAVPKTVAEIEALMQQA